MKWHDWPALQTPVTRLHARRPTLWCLLCSSNPVSLKRYSPRTPGEAAGPIGYPDAPVSRAGALRHYKPLCFALLRGVAAARCPAELLDPSFLHSDFCEKLGQRRSGPQARSVTFVASVATYRPGPAVPDTSFSPVIASLLRHCRQEALSLHFATLHIFVMNRVL